jgi:hypothetical protein
MANHDALSGEDEARLEQARAWVKGHFTEGADQKYAMLDDKLRVLDAILANDWVSLDETWKLQALGVTFGDALAEKLMLDWVVVHDEIGRDPALNWPGNSLLCYPLTMIAKRIEAGQRVDVYDLFRNTEQVLCDAAFSGRYV